MKIRLLNILILFLFIASNKNISQSFEQLNSYIENPEVFSENQEITHVPLFNFSSISSALENDYKNSPFYISLNGKWSFYWSKHPEKSEENFFSKDYNISDWDKITVPSVWQLQGYGYKIYRNIPVDFSNYDPPFVPNDYNPVGYYITDFQIPIDWDGNEIFLHFDGVQSASFVWVNGNYVGFDEGSMTPSEYNISKFIQKGKNKLAVRVHRWSDGTYLENQDCWKFSGIYRDVYLFSVPKIHIRDLFIRTDLVDDYKNANLLCDVYFPSKIINQIVLNNIDFQLFDEKNTKVDDWSYKIDHPDSIISLKRKIKNPLLWSDEYPNLYTLVVILKDEKEEINQIISQKIGFREINIIDGEITLNGKPLEIRGVNRHEHHPISGRTMNTEMIIKDFELMKKFNVNSVRLSHYPNIPIFYELADKYGILLQDEVNAESHYGENDPSGKYSENWMANEPSWQSAYFERFERMLERDKNHPSVIFWSTGNEAGTGPAHFKMADYAKNYDGTRLIMHQSNHPNGDAEFADVSGPRYISPDKLRSLAINNNKPIVMGEYAHAMGNSLGHFDEYWKTIRSYKRLNGGYIWDWVDQGVETKLIKLNDNSIYQNLVFLRGNPKQVSRNQQHAIELSGLDDWIEVYNSDLFDSIKDEIALYAEVFPREWNGYNCFISKGDKSFLLEQISKDEIAFILYSKGKKNIITAKLPNNWTHKWNTILATAGNGLLKLYINNKLVSEGKFEGTIDKSYFPVFIGNNAERNHSNFASRTSNALIDNVMIFNISLLPEEIKSEVLASNKNLLLNLDFEVLDTTETKYYDYGIDNFSMNGMVFANRDLQPEIWQLKKSHSPIIIDSVSTSNGIYKIHNFFHSTNFDEFYIDWMITSFEDTIFRGNFSKNIEPLTNDTVKINYDLKSFQNRSPLLLTISAKRKEAITGVPKDHEITFEQFYLTPYEPEKISISKISHTKLKVVEDNASTIIEGQNFKYTFNKQRGSLESAIVNGCEIIKQGPKLSVYRPPTDNEMVHWSVAEVEEWRRLKLNNLEEHLNSFDLIVNENSVKIICILSYYGLEDRNELHGFDTKIIYEIFDNGDILLNHEILPFGRLPWLPKVGLLYIIDKKFDNLKWYGRGPEESYPDRKSGLKIATYSGKVSEQFVPYYMPQENGNKTEVLSLELTNNDGIGFQFSSDKSFNFNVSSYSPDNIERARHLFELKESDNIHLSIDDKVSGVGCTPIETRLKYRVYPVHTQYSILIRPKFQSKK